jgi:hypothetical protein
MYRTKMTTMTVGTVGPRNPRGATRAPDLITLKLSGGNAFDADTFNTNVNY